MKQTGLKQCLLTEQVQIYLKFWNIRKNYMLCGSSAICT